MIFSTKMCGSYHIIYQYRIRCQTLDVYLLSAIWTGQIQSKRIYIFVIYEPASL